MNFFIREKIADWRGRGLYAGFPDRFKTIFIHVPKTAGNSVVSVLFAEEGGKHAPFSTYQGISRRKFESYFKFAFVRNPWDRLLSLYFYYTRPDNRELKSGAFARVFPTFEDFVLGCVNEKNTTRIFGLFSQCHYLCAQDGRIMVDFLGRYENLDADTEIVARRLGIDRDVHLPKKNASEHAHYSCYYNKETKKIVERVYATDIKVFGYDFENRDKQSR